VNKVLLFFTLLYNKHGIAEWDIKLSLLTNSQNSLPLCTRTGNLPSRGENILVHTEELHVFSP